MKLEQVKPLFEGVSKSIEGIDIRRSKMLDPLAHDLAEHHFPESFKLTLKTSQGNVIVRFQLENKKINDARGHHIATFVYELDRESSERIQKKLKSFESDSDKHDDLEEELNVDTIEVHAEFGKEVSKVYAVVA